MKKLIVAFLLTVVIVAIAFAFFVRKKLATVDAAALIPAESILLLHVPDVARTRERWTETALAKIAREPEVAAFLERPKAKAPQLRDLYPQANRILAIEPREAFAAVTSLAGQNNVPRFVAGFSFKGKKQDVEALIADARKQIQSAAPEGKADLVLHQGATIETFTARNMTIAGVFAKQWYFAANDLELLKSTLDRFNGAPTDHSLRKNKAFASSMVRMPREADGIFFMQPKELSDRLATFVAASGQPANPGIEEMRKIEAISATTKLEKENVRDTMFVLKPGLGNTPPMQRNSLAFTSADTSIYYAAVTKFAAPNFALPDPSLDVTGILRQIEAMGSLLQGQGLGWTDFGAAFGPETSLAMDWPATSMQPGGLVSIDIRDLPKAKKIVETLTAGKAGGLTWSHQNTDGIDYYGVVSQGIAFVTPTVALTDKFLVFGLNFESVRNAVAKARANDGRLDQTTEFEKATGAVNKPGSAFGYVAAKPLFERMYGTARPLAFMWSTFVPKIGDYIDVNKLPATETISKHLGPIIFSQSTTDDGILTESVGPITMGQAAVALGAVAGAAAVPMIKTHLGMVPAQTVSPTSAPTPRRFRQPDPLPGQSTVPPGGVPPESDRIFPPPDSISIPGASVPSPSPKASP